MSNVPIGFIVVFIGTPAAYALLWAFVRWVNWMTRKSQ